MNKPKILFYDIETAPLKAWVWGCGKQFVSYKQLDKNHAQYGIICIAYCWNDGKPAKVIDWGYEQQDTKSLIAKFDEIIKQADHTIGKNSNKFDSKMINAARMLNGLPGLPEWMMYRDDLEMQMRKYFRMPSQSLDYLSQQLGLGGKNDMVFQDWIDIVEKNSNGRKALKKMKDYNKKDTEDTRDLWNMLSEHFDTKFNMATFSDTKCCKHADCGSTNLRVYDKRLSGKTVYNLYRCRDCNRYAGRAPLSKVLQKEGKIG